MVSAIDKIGQIVLRRPDGVKHTSERVRKSLAKDIWGCRKDSRMGCGGSESQTTSGPVRLSPARPPVRPSGTGRCRPPWGWCGRPAWPRVRLPPVHSSSRPGPSPPRYTCSSPWRHISLSSHRWCLGRRRSPSWREHPPPQRPSQRPESLSPVRETAADCTLLQTQTQTFK